MYCSQGVKRDGTWEALEELKLNNAIREVFLNRFTHLFCDYDHFVIQPDCQVSERTLTCFCFAYLFGYLSVHNVSQGDIIVKAEQ